MLQQTQMPQGPPPRAREVFTPSQLNTLARDLLEGAFALVWVEAELCNVSRPASGHLYFTLKDARAQVRCALFKPKSQWLKFVPTDGIRVLARGRLTLYEPRGDYQLVLEHMEEAGEGALRRAFEELKAKLAGKGLFDAARKQPLPAFPRRVGVITSPGGAVVRDILSVLARRFPLVEVDVLPVPVQGATAAAQIAAMLRRADRSARYDVLLLARGGGSLEDLSAFNDEGLARTIAACVTPVVSAVGHETDFSLADFAADLRAPTPSAAAELLTPDRPDLAQRIGALRRSLHDRLQRQLREASQRSDRSALRLQVLHPRARLDALRQRHFQAQRRLHGAWAVLARARAVRIDRARAALAVEHPSRRLRPLRARLEQAAPRMRSALVRRLHADTLRLRGLARALDAVSPLATVARGYAVLRQAADGRLVHSITQVRSGDRLLGRVADGEIDLRVEVTTPLPEGTTAGER